MSTNEKTEFQSQHSSEPIYGHSSRAHPNKDFPFGLKDFVLFRIIILLIRT